MREMAKCGSLISYSVRLGVRQLLVSQSSDNGAILCFAIFLCKHTVARPRLCHCPPANRIRQSPALLTVDFGGQLATSETLAFYFHVSEIVKWNFVYFCHKISTVRGCFVAEKFLVLVTITILGKFEFYSRVIFMRKSFTAITYFIAFHHTLFLKEHNF